MREVRLRFTVCAIGRPWYAKGAVTLVGERPSGDGALHDRPPSRVALELPRSPLGWSAIAQHFARFFDAANPRLRLFRPFDPSDERIAVSGPARTWRMHLGCLRSTNP